VVVAILSSLGAWQLRRHAWRQQWLAERNARIELPPAAIAGVLADPAAFSDRRAVARGRFLAAESIVVRQVAAGREGSVKVLTPLALSPPSPADGPLLLVDRGFVPGSRLESFLAADLARAPADVELEGLVLPLAVQPVIPGSASERHRDWQRFAPARPDAVAALQAQISRPLAPVWLEAAAGAPGELPEGGITRPTSPVDHVSYALFWFAMALLAAGHWVGFGFHHAREAGRAADRARLTAPPIGDGKEGDET
jgi:surfeit locus 1 family protein